MAIKVIPRTDGTMTFHQVRPPSLNPKPLEKVSFSSWNTLRKCPTNLAFQRDKSTSKWKKGNTSASLGTIAHELVELALQGNISSDDSLDGNGDLENKWDSLIRKQNQDLMKVKRLGEIPAPERWPRYQEKKLRTIRSVLKIISRTHNTVPTKPSSISERQLNLEEITGSIDRVDIEGDLTTLVDLKTSDPDHEEGPRETYVEQLLFYAFSWWKEKGDWPTALKIEYLDGSDHDITVDKKRAIDIGSEALALKQKFNETPSGTYEQLAKPSEENCRWCDYRAACNPFLDENESREWFRNGDFKGKVSQVAENGSWFDLELEKPPSAYETIRVRNLPPDYSPSAQDLVSIGEAKVGKGQNIQVNWQSVLWKWEH